MKRSYNGRKISKFSHYLQWTKPKYLLNWVPQLNLSLFYCPINKSYLQKSDNCQSMSKTREKNIKNPPEFPLHETTQFSLRKMSSRKYFEACVMNKGIAVLVKIWAEFFKLNKKMNSRKGDASGNT